MAERKGPFCGGRLRRGKEGTCRRAAGAGTDHLGAGRCSWHGGSSPSGSQSAHEQMIEAEAARVLYKHDAPAVTNHLDALQRLAGRALALEETIGAIVNDLRKIRYKDDKGAEQLRAEVAVLERAMDRCGRLLVDIAKLNIEERLARVTEQQAEEVSKALSLALAEMGLTHAQQRDAREKVARHLRAVLCLPVSPRCSLTGWHLPSLPSSRLSATSLRASPTSGERRGSRAGSALRRSSPRLPSST